MPRKAQYAPEDLYDIEQEKRLKTTSVPVVKPLRSFNKLEPEELQYHKVTGNESIGSIAGMYGVTPQALVGANPSMQSTPPAGSWVAVPTILPSQIQADIADTQTQPWYLPQIGPSPIADITQPQPLSSAVSQLNNLFNLALEKFREPVFPPEVQASGKKLVWEKKAGKKPVPAKIGVGEATVSSAVASAASVSQNLEPEEKKYILRDLMGDEAIANIAKANLKYQINRLNARLLLAMSDWEITGIIETRLLPPSVPANMYPYLPQEVKDALKIPLIDGGYGAVYNPKTQAFDLPSTAPGVKLTPGMALRKADQHRVDTGEVDQNFVPYFIMDDELAIYTDEPWANEKRLKALGGIHNDEGNFWYFPNSNNKPTPTAPSPTGGGGGGEIYKPIYKPKAVGGGGGGEEPSPSSPQPQPQPQPAGTVQPLSPENQKAFDQIMAHEVDSETAIRQLEWFINSGYLSLEQSTLAQQELMRLKAAKQLAMQTSYGTSKSIWRIG